MPTGRIRQHLNTSLESAFLALRSVGRRVDFGSGTFAAMSLRRWWRIDVDGVIVGVTGHVLVVGILGIRGIGEVGQRNTYGSIRTTSTNVDSALALEAGIEDLPFRSNIGVGVGDRKAPKDVLHE